MILLIVSLVNAASFNKIALWRGPINCAQAFSPKISFQSDQVEICLHVVMLASQVIPALYLRGILLSVETNGSRFSKFGAIMRNTKALLKSFSLKRVLYP